MSLAFIYLNNIPPIYCFIVNMVSNGESRPDGMCCLLCFSVFVKAAFKISDNFCLLVSVFRGERGEVVSEDSKRFSYLRRECYKSVCF